MQIYTYSEARQKLAFVLEQAESTGKVLTRRKDGRTCVSSGTKYIFSIRYALHQSGNYHKRNCGYYSRRKRKVERTHHDDLFKRIISAAPV